MNIFVLDRDPLLAAQYMCNKHVVKMILETYELLYIASRRIAGAEIPLRFRRHANHPCAKWAAANWANFSWLRSHGNALLSEYTYRYGKIHAYNDRMNFMLPTIWLESQTQKEVDPRSIPQCMPVIYKDPDPVEAYRNYYMGAKTHMLKYTKRAPPQWLIDNLMGEHIDGSV